MPSVHHGLTGGKQAERRLEASSPRRAAQRLEARRCHLAPLNVTQPGRRHARSPSGLLDAEAGGPSCESELTLNRGKQTARILGSGISWALSRGHGVMVAALTQRALMRARLGMDRRPQALGFEVLRARAATGSRI